MNSEYIGIKQVGTPQWPRYIVVKDDWFWTGTDWAPIFRAGMLFANMRMAVEERNKLVQSQADGAETEEEDWR